MHAGAGSPDPLGGSPADDEAPAPEYAEAHQSVSFEDMFGTTEVRDAEHAGAVAGDPPVASASGPGDAFRVTPVIPPAPGHPAAPLNGRSTVVSTTPGYPSPADPAPIAAGDRSRPVEPELARPATERPEPPAPLEPEVPAHAMADRAGGPAARSEIPKPEPVVIILEKRVPGSSLFEGSFPPPVPVPSAPRSAESVREALSSFQDGYSRAPRRPADDTPRNDEEEQS